MSIPGRSLERNKEQHLSLMITSQCFNRLRHHLHPAPDEANLTGNNQTIDIEVIEHVIAPDTTPPS